MTNPIQGGSPYLPTDLVMEVFSYVQNPLIARGLSWEMRTVVDYHHTFFYRPIYLQMVAIEGVDILTFEEERQIDPHHPFDLKVRKGWDMLNLYRRLNDLPVLHPMGNMVEQYKVGHEELQKKLILARVSFWIALGGAVHLDTYTPQELGLQLRRWLKEHYDPQAYQITLRQNICKSIPPEIAFFRSLRVLNIEGHYESQEMINQLKELNKACVTQIEKIIYEAMKMNQTFNI